jgi:hypothetical protein
MPNILAFAPFVLIYGFYGFLVYALVKHYRVLSHIGQEIQNIRVILAARSGSVDPRP